MHYPQLEGSVQPPAGWNQSKRALLKQSASVPNKALRLSHVYGYNSELSCRNLWCGVSGEKDGSVEGGSVLLHAIAAIVVVTDADTLEQVRAMRLVTFPHRSVQ